MKPLTVAWFSAGVSSAVATKLALRNDGVDHIIYTHIDDQHPDTERFLRECEHWFCRPIERVQSHLRTVADALLAAGGCFMRGPSGAPCTKLLKIRVRKEWERAHPGPKRYIWGMDCTEADRLSRLRETMPEQEHVCPLIDQRIAKTDAHEMLAACGIKRPAMYDLGYHNNNCVGCLKGSMGYWNKIRKDFPDVFAGRVALERRIGASILKRGGKPYYLDELDPGMGRHEGPICNDCGIMCELDRAALGEGEGKGGGA